MALLAGLRNPNIVHLFGTTVPEDEDELWAVLEYCALGSLERVLRVFKGDAAEPAEAILRMIEDSKRSNQGGVGGDGDGGGGGGDGDGGGGGGGGGTLGAAAEGDPELAVKAHMQQLWGGPLPGINTAFYRVMHDVAKGVAYLHDQRIVHR